MTSTRGAINRTSAARYDIDGLLAAIEGVPTVTDPVAVRRRSRDFFWYSPILNQQLAAKSADILVARATKLTSSGGRRARVCAFR